MISLPALRVVVAGAVLALAACGGAPPDDPEAAAGGSPGAAADPQTGGQAAEPPGEGGPELPVAPLERLEVTLYFPAEVDEGLRGEAREIFDTASPVERAKQIVSDLIAGPADDTALAALPRGTRLRQVFVLDDGTAWVDFSSELRDGMSGGSHTEMLAVYSIVNSLVLNIPEIERVGILINGRPCDTLTGHMDLRLPLRAAPWLHETGRGVTL